MHISQVPEAVFVIEPRHVLGYCHVPKVASSLWMIHYAEMNNLPQNTIQQKSKAMTLHLSAKMII